MLAVLLALLGAVSASAALVPGWTQGPRLDPAVPTGLACPSASLCVGVDASGDLLVTKDPTAAAPAWTGAALDPGGSLSGVSCPSTALCVAIDLAGRVLTSVDPAAGVASWNTGPVGSDGPSSLASVSCPTVSLCVAVGGQDVAFSDDPAAGAASWTVMPDVDQRIDYECGKYDEAPGACPAVPFASVSCPSASLCAAIDAEGGGTTSIDPGSTNGWPMLAGLDDANNEGPIVCPSIGLCLTQCAAGFGEGACPGSTYGAGEIVTSDPTGPAGSRYQTISPDPLSGLWCASISCYAAASNGTLLASSDPSDPDAWWQHVLTLTPASANETIDALACPTSTLCLALTSDGQLVSGPTPATRAEVLTALRTTLRPDATETLRQLARFDGYRQTVHAIVPGRLTITVSDPRSGVIVARAAQSFRHPTTTTIKIALTSRGRRLPHNDTSMRFNVRGVFAASGTSAVTATERLTILTS
jgi:hypothetical protein